VSPSFLDNAFSPMSYFRDVKLCRIFFFCLPSRSFLHDLVPFLVPLLTQFPLPVLIDRAPLQSSSVVSFSLRTIPLCLIAYYFSPDLRPAPSSSAAWSQKNGLSYPPLLSTILRLRPIGPAPLFQHRAPPTNGPTCSSVPCFHFLLVPPQSLLWPFPTS